MNDNYLEHHGVKGMKWGVRKAPTRSSVSNKKSLKKQNNSTFRNLLKKNTNRTIVKKPVAKKQKSKNKSVKEMSDDELRKAINRIELEKRYSSLNPKQVSKGRKIVSKVMNDVIVPSIENAGKQALTEYASKTLKKQLGLNDSDTTKSLQKEVSNMNLRKQKIELDDYFDKRKKR